MRMATLRTQDGTRAAVRDGDTWLLQPEPDLREFLFDPRWRDRASSAVGDRITRDDAVYAPLVPRPGKIVCVGLNYRNHIAEMGREEPAYPTLFTKFPEALIGASDDIELPGVSEQIDWEAELAVVVGAKVRFVTEDEARPAIAGYSVANDVTVRDWQYRTTQWLPGKTFEATTPLGPELVTGDEVDDAVDLRVQCAVDGEVMQDDRTSELIFTPAALVAYLSTIITLEPGDVILTGTSGGVGHARKPARYLTAGSVLTTTIEGVGTCTNTCVGDRR